MAKKKKTVFLFRGLTREKRHWGEFYDDLKEALLPHNVVSLDLPGFGDKNDVESPGYIKDIVNLVLKYPEFELYKDTDFILVGLSLGAMVSLELSILKPETFNSVVVINTSQRFKTSFYKRIKLSYLVPFIFIYLFNLKRLREKLILKSTLNKVNDQRLIQKWCGYYDEKPFTFKSALKQSLAGARFSLENHLSELKDVKGLVLLSEKDKLVHPDNSKILAKLLNWPMFKNSETGHDLPVDDPPWTIKKIKNFIED
jgi:pimeloyl-ACP methyl ester carboxylesterase